MDVRSIPTGGAQRKPITIKNTENKETPPPLIRQDVSDFSSKKTENWDTFLKDWMATTRINLDGVSITIVAGDQQGLLRYASTASSGAHLLVGHDFLRAMAKDEASYQRGSDLLGQVISLLQGSAKEGAIGAQISASELTFWAADAPQGGASVQEWEREAESAKGLLELMEKARKDIEQLQKKFQIPVNKNLYQARAEAMSRLSRATTAAGVTSAVSMARRSIGTLKMALRTGDESEKKKIRTSIAGLESVAVRGARKKRSLREEQVISQRQEQAKVANQRRKEAQLRHELQQRKAVRKVRERAQITEGIQPIPQQEYARKLQAYEANVAPEAVFVAVPTVATVAPVAQAAPEATPTVSVAPAIAISI